MYTSFDAGWVVGSGSLTLDTTAFPYDLTIGYGYLDVGSPMPGGTTRGCPSLASVTPTGIPCSATSTTQALEIFLNYIERQAAGDDNNIVFVLPQFASVPAPRWNTSLPFLTVTTVTFPIPYLYRRLDSCDMYHGDPIHALSGNVKWTERDVKGAVGFSRTYSSALRGTSELSPGWAGDYFQRVTRLDASRAIVLRPSGISYQFILGQMGWTPTADVTDQLILTSTGWTYQRADGAIEVFDNSGVLQKIVDSNGRTVTVNRIGNELQVVDHSGRVLRLLLNSTGKLSEIWSGSTKLLSYLYTDEQLGRAAQLVGVQYVNQNSIEGKGYTYGHGGFGELLTSIVDENNYGLPTPVPYVQWTYDVLGRGTGSANAGGVNVYTLRRPDERTMVLTSPNGGISTHGYNNLGAPRPTSVSQPAGAGCNAATKSAAFDVNGNYTQKTDFEGRRSCMEWDTTRNLETGRVEGLLQGSSCPWQGGLAQSIYTNSEASKTLTQWHPKLRVLVRKAEPGLIVTSVYNGQPDPLAGGVVANCAPSTSTLPDGSPIGVLCRKYEQATLDKQGMAGFSATLDPTVPTRRYSYTYNETGQVLTETGPRTDVVDTKTYAYYSDKTADHYPGDLASITNALGHVTTFDRYDDLGQLLRSTDANGVTTTFVYDGRQHLVSSTSQVGGTSLQTTSYEYDKTGQLVSAILPSGVVMNYTYDDAHRLTEVRDSSGNSISYSLDNAGNIVSEVHKDPAGQAAKSVAYVYDALNRLQQLQQSPIR